MLRAKHARSQQTSRCRQRKEQRFLQTRADADRISRYGVLSDPMPIAQPKTSLLIDEINSMVESGPDEGRILTIQREIDLLERSGFYADAKQLEGMLAGLRKDEEGVRNKFRAAVITSSRDPLVRTNFAHALSNVRCLTEAVQVIDEVCDEYPDDVNILLAALEIHESAYDLQGCLQLIQKINQLGMDNRVSAAKLEKLQEMALALEGRNVAWTDLAERIERASKVILRSKLRFHTIEETISSDEIFCEFGIIGSMEDAIFMERAIHQEIAMQPYSPADSILSFACLPDEHPSN